MQNAINIDANHMLDNDIIPGKKLLIIEMNGSKFKKLI